MLVCIGLSALLGSTTERLEDLRRMFALFRRVNGLEALKNGELSMSLTSLNSISISCIFLYSFLFPIQKRTLLLSKTISMLISICIFCFFPTFSYIILLCSFLWYFFHCYVFLLFFFSFLYAFCLVFLTLVLASTLQASQPLLERKARLWSQTLRGRKRWLKIFWIFRSGSQISLFVFVD